MSEGALFDRSSFNLEGATQAQVQLPFAYLLGLQLRVSFQVSDVEVERRMFRSFLNGVACVWFYLGAGGGNFQTIASTGAKCPLTKLGQSLWYR